MPSSHLILCRPLSPPAPNPSHHQGLFQPPLSLYPTWNPKVSPSHHKPLREHASPPLFGTGPLGEGHGKKRARVRLRGTSLESTDDRDVLSGIGYGVGPRKAQTRVSTGEPGVRGPLSVKTVLLGLHRGSDGKELAIQRPWFDPWVGKIPWRRE